MRSLPALVAVALCAATVAGCGGSGSGAVGGGGAAGNGTQAAASTAAGASSRVSGGGAETTAATTPHRILVGGRQPLSDGDADNPEDVDGNPDHDPKGDSDTDTRTRASYDFPDADDVTAFGFGQAADAAQRASIAGVVQRYYQASRSGNGATACALLLRPIANAVPATYGQGVGSQTRGPKQTCAAVIAALFKRLDRHLPPSISVVAVRVQGDHAEAVLGSFTGRATNIYLDRQGSSWGVEQVLATVLL